MPLIVHLVVKYFTSKMLETFFFLWVFGGGGRWSVLPDIRWVGFCSITVYKVGINRATMVVAALQF